MPGNYTTHLDEFGVCFDRSHEGVEMMALESEDEYGRWSTDEVPACAVCFGLK